MHQRKNNDESVIFDDQKGQEIAKNTQANAALVSSSGGPPKGGSCRHSSHPFHGAGSMCARSSLRADRHNGTDPEQRHRAREMSAFRHALVKTAATHPRSTQGRTR
jgi:hypothetical protein